MLYHQSEQKEKTHRTTALAKIIDKYDYTDITFPISYDQVTMFEDTIKITINIWKVADDKKTPICIAPVMSYTAEGVW